MSGQVDPVAPGARVELPSLLPGVLAPRPARTLDPGHDGPRPRTLRDWLVDIGCIVISLVIGASLVDVHVLAAHPTYLPWQLDAAAGTVACLALWWRRRWPLGLAIALTAVGTFSSMGAVAVTVGVFTVAVHRPAVPALLVGAANVVTVPLYFALQAVPGEPLWINAGIGVLITVTAMGWGMFTRARRQLIVSLTERALRAEAEQQQQRVEQARRNERARIAREMHDVLAHRLSLVSLHAGALEFRPDAPAEEVQLAASVIREGAHQALQELREVIGLLREDVPATPDRPPEPPQPALTDVSQLVREATEAGEHIRYHCTVTDSDRLPDGIGRTAYRIVQEALTNARKHAPSAEVRLEVGGGPGEGLRIEAVNPLPPAGRRPVPVPGAGLGLVGLAERVDLAGGRLDHGVRPDGAFALRAWLPWPA